MPISPLGAAVSVPDRKDVGIKRALNDVGVCSVETLAQPLTLCLVEENKPVNTFICSDSVSVWKRSHKPAARTSSQNNTEFKSHSDAFLRLSVKHCETPQCVKYAI